MSDVGHTADPLSLSGAMPEVELVGESKLTWYDVSAIGSGQMIINANWAFMVFLVSLYGLKWGVIGFFSASLVIVAAWWLYREMITAVPEPGAYQSYAREGGIFSLGTAYLMLFPFVYAGFNWLELHVDKAYLGDKVSGAPEWIWPIVLVLPVFLINLRGHQITGKIQAVMVGAILTVDLIVGVVFLTALSRGALDLNWKAPQTVGLLGFLTVTGLWIGLMAGVLETQQVLVDEWDDFKKSRDLGLLFSSWQLWLTQGLLGFGIFALLPLDKLATMPIPLLGVAEAKWGQGFLYVVLAIFAVLSTATTLNVYFMAMGRILAMYAMQGALPRVFALHSRRAVPWFSLVVLLVIAIAGAYLTNFTFLVTMLSTWGTTLYVVIAIIYLAFSFNKRLERPLRAKFGVPIAVAMLVFGAMQAYGIFKLNTKASLYWCGIALLMVAYDALIVPRTRRGQYYRREVLRRRTSAARLE